MCCNRNNFVNNGCYRNCRNTCWNSWWYQNSGCQSTGNIGSAGCGCGNTGNAGNHGGCGCGNTGNGGSCGCGNSGNAGNNGGCGCGKQWERWKQRLRKYRKHWELRLHWQRRMLDGGVLQRPVVDHPVPGRKIRVQDGIKKGANKKGEKAGNGLWRIRAYVLTAGNLNCREGKSTDSASSGERYPGGRRSSGNRTTEPGAG